MSRKQFKQIIQENNERIERICRYYSNSPQDQEDLHQEILMQIWNSLDNFRGDAQISTWIYKVAVNVSLTFRKNSYKALNLYVDSNTQNLDNLIAFEDIDNQIFEKRFNILKKEINQLSVVEKALISLVLEGLSIKEIAEVIGITEANTKVKIHRIKRDLSNRLKGKDYE